MENYFKGKRVLITGITGFVGKNLSAKLTFLGSEVYGISKSLESKRIKRNILDYKGVNEFIKAKKIAICFHLAGESIVESGQKDPYDTFRTNIQGTINILESARKNKLEKIIIASTAHVYGKNKLPYRESYTPKPSRPYETSKACADLIAQSYAATFNLPVLIPRFVNIYGPGDLNFTRLIPRTIKAVFTHDSVSMWGGEAIRDYLYIDDALDAYLSLAMTDSSDVGGNTIFNFGSGNKISVKDLIALIISLSNKNLSIERIDEKRPSEIKSQYVSFSRARNVLSWKPHVGLDKGLKKTLSWYKDYFSG